MTLSTPGYTAANKANAQMALLYELQAALHRTPLVHDPHDRRPSSTVPFRGVIKCYAKHHDNIPAALLNYVKPKGACSMYRLFLILAASIGLFMIALSPAHAKLYQTQSIATVTFNSTTFGPVGPNCSATDGGPDCAFFTSTFTTTTQNNPFGPSTGTGIATALFGVGGIFVTPSGAHDANGNPTGGCF